MEDLDDLRQPVTPGPIASVYDGWGWTSRLGLSIQLELVAWF